jgi:hypothetical protein
MFFKNFDKDTRVTWWWHVVLCLKRKVCFLSSPNILQIENFNPNTNNFTTTTCCPCGVCVNSNEKNKYNTQLCYWFIMDNEDSREDLITRRTNRKAVSLNYIYLVFFHCVIILYFWGVWNQSSPSSIHIYFDLLYQKKNNCVWLTDVITVLC